MKYVKVKNIVLGDDLTKICVPVTGISEKEILKEFNELNNIDFDLIELRIDYYEHLFNELYVINLLKEIRKVYNKPLLFTIRTKDEGGNIVIDDEYYFFLNNKVIESGLVDLTDIEYLKDSEHVKKLINNAKNYDVKTVLSHHQFKKMISKEEILLRLNEMANLGSDISKIAVMPNVPEDVLTLLEASLAFKNEKKGPFIAVAMGPLGIISRISCNIFGSCMTFASYKNSSAPGQMDVRLIKEILKIIN